MDLKAILDYVGTILDYSPDTTQYRTQAASVVNDAYTSCIANYPWPFAQETVEVTAYKDIELELTFTNGSANFTSTVPLNSTMDGHYVKVGSVYYRIGWIESTTSGWLQEVWSSTTGTYDCKILFLYLHVPPRAQAIQSVAVFGTGKQGTIAASTRRDAENNDLPTSDTGDPSEWHLVDSDRIPAPRKVSGLSTSLGVGQGTRTLDFAMTYVWAGRESALSPVTSATYTPTQIVTWTPDALAGSTPYYRRLYVRAPKHGVYGWRLVEDTSTKQTDVSPLGTVTITTALSQTTVEGEAFAIQRPRYQGSPGGTAQRIRLYPRVGEPTVITVRYTRHPTPLEEDSDTPLIPVQHRMYLAHRTIELLALKHDQTALASSHAARANAAYARMVSDIGGVGHKAPATFAVGGNRRSSWPFDISNRGKASFS